VFEPTSRYAPIEETTITTSDGRTVAYKRRRFLPQGRSLPLLAKVTVTEGDRLDVITHRALGDPEHFWRIADANDGMNPSELTAPPGRVLRVPVPGM
jgi:nucleoid-associated protein YgaU